MKLVVVESPAKAKTIGKFLGVATNNQAEYQALIEGLAAGTYELTVSAFVPEARQRPPRTKQLVTVTDGAATDVIVTIDLTPPPPR